MSNIYNKRQSYLLGIFFAIFFILIYALNYFYPLCFNDWAYSFIYGTNDRVECISDIFISQYKHYYEWGGRSVTHVIAQYLLFIDLRYSVILNSCVFVIFVWLLYKYANAYKYTNAHLFLFVFAAIFISQRVFMSTAVWLTGSANYLWGTTITLLFLYAYYTYYVNNRQGNTSWLKSIPMFLGGIIIGWCNENTSVCLIIILIVLCWLLKNDGKKIPVWYFAGIIGVVIGFIIMIKAPGNYVRYAEIMEQEEFGDNIFAHVLNVRIPIFFERYYQTLLIPTVCWLGLFFFFFRTHTNEKTVQFSMLLAIAAHIGFISMIAAPFFPKRATFSLITFIIIAVAILYNNTDFYTTKLKIVNKTTILGSLCVFFVIYYSWRLSYTISLHNEFKEREIELIRQKNHNIKDIVFTKKISMPYEFGFNDMGSDSTFWLNRCYALYNEVNTVRLLPENNKEE